MPHERSALRILDLPRWTALALLMPVALLVISCASTSRTPTADATADTAVTAAPAAEPQTIDRTVALATFDETWQIVNDTHFDPSHLDAVGWVEAREELRPRAAETTSNDELRRVIADLLARLDQSHFTLIPGERVEVLDPTEVERAAESSAARPVTHDEWILIEEEDDSDESGASSVESDRPGSIGIDVRLIDRQILVTRVESGSPADTAGVRLGWAITRVGSREISDLLERLPTDVDPRLRLLYAQTAVLARLRGDDGSVVDVAFLDGSDQPVELTLERKGQAGVASRIGNLPVIVCQTESRRFTTAAGGNAGYIWFNIWLVPIMAPVSMAVDRYREADGIVMDLRGNPGGIGGMSMGMAGHFLDDRVTLGTMSVRDQNPLNFVAFPQRVNPAGKRVTPYQGPLAILVDAQTGSTSEIFAGGMQSVGRARVFGETSMGAALPARMPKLANGDVLLHAFADYVDSNGVRLEGRGVVPDETVSLTRPALLQGRDPVLEAALEWIDQHPVQPTEFGTE